LYSALMTELWSMIRRIQPPRRKAMKLGGGVFGIANSKNTDGSWNFHTFGDGSGFTADLITSGKIKADFLQDRAGEHIRPRIRSERSKYGGS